MPANPNAGNRFPLSLHKATGQWRKQIRGKDYYFGTDRHAALARYVQTRAALEAGRLPSPLPGDLGPTVEDVCDGFLNARRSRMAAGELTPGMWSQYRGACLRMVVAFGPTRPVAGLQPGDFAELRESAAAGLGPRALGQFVVMARTVFKWAYETELIDAVPRYGPDFKIPPRRLVRVARAERGSMLIQPGDLRRMIEAADPAMRAMLYLGINCGYGPTDCSRLNQADLAREPGWLSGARTKTGSARRCPLWGETVEALKAAEGVRPRAKESKESDAVFLTRMGRRWVRHTDRPGQSVSRRDSLGTAFDRLATRCDVALAGRFYVLRHTFRTIADQAKDQPAADLIMGHAEGSMAGHYREVIDDGRLIAVAEVVRGWLLASQATTDIDRDGRE
jgi:integrase